MRVSWLEMQELPAFVVEDYRLVMEAEAQASAEAERKAKQRKR